MHIQVDGMVKESGVFYVKTEQERELEKRVKERKQELMEIYRAQKEQRKEAKASQHLSETKPQSRSDEVEEKKRQKNKRNEMEDRVGVSHTHNRLYSVQQSAPHYVREVATKSSSRLNSGKTWHHILHLIFVLEAPQPGKKKSNFLYFSVGGAEQISEVNRSPNKTTACKSIKYKIL